MKLRSKIARLVQIALLGAIVALARPLDRTALDVNSGGPLLVTDRDGTLLRSVPNAAGRPGREAWVRLSDVHSLAIQVLLSAEDRNFFSHSGVDTSALLRSLWLSTTSGRLYGGSTLSMQLARLVYFPEQPRSLWRKLRQIETAWRLERALSKSEILEQYLNRAYFGEGAYGIEAAALHYFDVRAKSLNASQASLLMVLPRGPRFYNLRLHLHEAEIRRHHLLELAQQDGRVAPSEIAHAEEAVVLRTRQAPVFLAPYFVDDVLSHLPQSTTRDGGIVRTTLDSHLQEVIENHVRTHVANNAHDGIEDAAVVVLSSATGEVHAMVGGASYQAHQQNLATWPRPPGSTLKPFLYATAFEQGFAPSSIAFDIHEASPQYIEGGHERGPVAFRQALAGSLNFAAMNVLEHVGGSDLNQKLLILGLRNDTRAPNGGWSHVALGNTPVALVDLTASYGVFFRGGGFFPARSVRAYQHQRTGANLYADTSSLRQVFSADAAWLTMHILSDSEARRPTFGEELAVDFATPIVAKTGTAQGFSDTWAILGAGYWLVGAWVGRRDGQSILGRPGMRAAAPLARLALLAATQGQPMTVPSRPASIHAHAVCALSGMAAGVHCAQTRSDYFSEGTQPTSVCTWHDESGVHYPEQLRAWAIRHHREAHAQ